MFCIGCASRLPGFAPTGPSGLEMIAATRRPRSQAIFHPATARAPGLPGMQALWLRLAVAGLVLTAGFTGWYVYVTRTVPGARPSASTADAVPSVVQLEPAAAPWPLSAPLPLAAAPDPRAATATPAAQDNAPTDAVAKFYRALSAGDGHAAAAFITPGRRGVGPYDEVRMSTFYRSFKEPLRLQSVRQIDADRVEARYSYRATRTPCQGVAIVETERVMDQTLIRRIRANC
ncbi:hypothetical protein [Variovorax sp. KK3]|uniref:hypothetical protein n=2 Tax=Variovorax sp. KK3 TaxID=1855728 RepID=UPI00097C5760